jgi:hypothetical protein
MRSSAASLSFDHCDARFALLTTAYLLHPTDLVALGITWGIGVVLMLVGAALLGRRVPPEVQIGAGWGGLCLLLTAWGVLVRCNLAIPATAFVLAAFAVPPLRGRRPSISAWKTMGRAALITLPLWLIIAPIRPSQPDTWLNLLPNAFYLVNWGRLPMAALPPSHSYLPGAPYNTQFLSYLGGFLWPNYPAAGMSLINVLLLMTSGLLIARALAMSPLAAEADLSWGSIAGGMLLATLLNPGFVPRFHLSAYGETPLAVTAAIAAWLWVSAQGEIAGGGNLSGALPAIGLILAAMINTKQSGIGLVAASAAAAVVTSWAENGRQRQRMLRGIGLAILPSLGLYLLWRYQIWVSHVGELKPLPLSLWNWLNIPAILASAGDEIAGKGVYFACVAAAVVLWPIQLRRQGWTATTRLLTYFAALLAFYNGFLLVMYIGLFPDEMSIEAHSFFRYNTHLSLVLVLTLTVAVRDLLPASWLACGRSVHARAAILSLALLTPVAFVKRMRFDLEMPQPLVWNLAKRLVPYLHDGDRLALLLPGDNGSVATMLRGVLADTPPRVRGLHLLRLDRADPAVLDEAFRRGYSLALVSCAPQGWAGLPAGQAVLLRRDPGGWRLLAAWPYPKDDTRQRWQYILSWAPLCRRS